MVKAEVTLHFGEDDLTIVVDFPSYKALDRAGTSACEQISDAIDVLLLRHYPEFASKRCDGVDIGDDSESNPDIVVEEALGPQWQATVRK
jgi:hypothetical protein